VNFTGLTDPHLYLTYLGVSVLLIVSPGPSVFLIVSVSLQRGLRAGLATVAGTNLGLFVALLLATAGLGALQGHAREAYEVVRWLGVVYLAAMGLRQLQTAARPRALPSPTKRHPFWEGLMVSLTNPTTTPFFVAWLPQFVDATRPAVPQFVLLGASFLVLAAILDTCWTVLASRLGQRFNDPVSLRWRQRLSGGLLVLCAVALALARITAP
jgi:homoserine/homoserine lactone efflux protein